MSTLQYEPQETANFRRLDRVQSSRMREMSAPTKYFQSTNSVLAAQTQADSPAAQLIPFIF
jgi:hypothetical protein